MRKETVAVWLGEHGPCSSTELRQKAGVTVKFTPIASRLSYMEQKHYAKVEAKGSVKIFSLTAKGKKWIKTPEVLHLVESVEEINAGNYGKNQRTVTPTARLNLDPTSEKAMSSFVELLDRGKKADQLIRSIMVQCQTFLDRGDSDESIPE